MYLVKYYIKWVKTSWTDSISHCNNFFAGGERSGSSSITGGEEDISRLVECMALNSSTTSEEGSGTQLQTRDIGI